MFLPLDISSEQRGCWGIRVPCIKCQRRGNSFCENPRCGNAAWNSPDQRLVSVAEHSAALPPNSLLLFDTKGPPLFYAFKKKKKNPQTLPLPCTRNTSLTCSFFAFDKIFQWILASRALKGLSNNPPHAVKYWKYQLKLRNTFWVFYRATFSGFPTLHLYHPFSVVWMLSNLLLSLGSSIGTTGIPVPAMFSVCWDVKPQRFATACPLC